MPSVSTAQHNAMEAAAHGHSKLGIPAAVGKEFVAADAFDESKHPRAADGKFGGGAHLTPEANEAAESLGMSKEYTGSHSKAHMVKHAVNNPIPRASGLTHEDVKALFNHAMARSGGKIGPKREFDISELRSTQDYVNPQIVAQHKNNIDSPGEFLPLHPPIVAKVDGKFVLLDGNHKVVASKVAGHKSIECLYAGEFPAVKTDSIDASGHEHGADGKFTGEGAGYTPKTTKILRQTGKQLGSNPGGQYHDMLGNKFYVKASKSAEHAANEILAGHLYKAAGAPITQAHAIEHEGKPGTISHWAEHDKEKFDPDNEDDRFEARDHFATHAWLGNWDAIGLGYDNQVPIGGKLHTVDAGGAMKFRAQGTPKGDKLWGPEVHELKSMRDPSLAPQAAKVFGNISQSHLKQSAERVKDVPDHIIRQLCGSHGHGTQEERMKTADLLIARKQDLLKKTEHI